LCLVRIWGFDMGITIFIFKEEPVWDSLKWTEAEWPVRNKEEGFDYSAVHVCYLCFIWCFDMWCHDK
jgi:hypothetical protein